MCVRLKQTNKQKQNVCRLVLDIDKKEDAAVQLVEDLDKLLADEDLATYKVVFDKIED